jgi:hypothetical protein
MCNTRIRTHDALERQPGRRHKLNQKRALQLGWDSKSSLKLLLKCEGASPEVPLAGAGHDKADLAAAGTQAAREGIRECMRREAAAAAAAVAQQRREHE